MILFSFVFRNFYPLKSGAGLISNSKFLKAIDGNPKTDAICRIGRYKLAIPENDYVGRSIKYFGDLDKKITWVIRQTLRPGDTAFDIGANLGLVSFKMLEIVGDSGKVIAFEPQSRMADYIEQSIGLNGIENLQLERIGLSDKPGTLKLSIPEHNAGAATFMSNISSNFEEASITTLDIFEEENRLGKVRVVKIDVEGFEEKVFNGAKNFIAKSQPDVIIFEENRNTMEKPKSVSVLEDIGYDIFSLPKTLFSVKLLPFQTGADAHDFVAVHHEASHELRKRLGLYS